VLAPAAATLVQRIEAGDRGLTAGRPCDVIDMGCGTGNLLFEAARRWPGARLVGLDGSDGMLDVARRRAAALPESLRARVSYVTSDAAAVPFPDASFDLVITGFMLQQVPDRPAAMAELYRITRPGGIIGLAGWLVEKIPFAPEVALEDALAESGVVRPAPRDVKSGHFRTARQATDELRRAGFRRVSARAGQLQHAWSAEGFITYRTTTRDLDLFEAMTAETRARTLAALRRRLGAMAPEDLVFEPPIVSIVAHKD
jgi:ubiquinone/menaquinone biosynthesis C-methylase UbiE